jgi:hypothetical protein
MKPRFYSWTHEHQMLPTGHGVVFRDYARNRCFTLPVGINLVARLLVELYWLIRVPTDSWWERRAVQTTEVMGFDNRDDGFYLQVDPPIRIHRGMKLRTTK